MDDVLQDAYARAFRALPGFRGDGAASTWLYRIVYNASLMTFVSRVRAERCRATSGRGRTASGSRHRPSRFSVPHIWAIDGPLVITITGNVDGDEPVRIAESLAR